MKGDMILKGIHLKAVALAYTALPVIVFMLGMLRPWIGVPAAAAVIAAAVMTVRMAAGRDDSRPEDGLHVNVAVLAALAVVAVAWCLLCGQCAVFAQKWDWFSRNATFRDLITHSWPVICEKQGGAALSFYFGHWLPSAVVGRAVMLATGSLDMAWSIGNICLGLWTAGGVFIVMLLLLFHLRAHAVLKIAVTVLTLLFFSGTSFFGYLFLLWKNGVVESSPWSALFQFTSNNSLLAWVFHQTVVPWIAILLLLDDERCLPYAAFVIALVPLCGAFPAVGLAWIAGAGALVSAVKALKANRFWPFLKSLASFPNLIGILVVVPVIASFLFTNTAAGEVCPAWKYVFPKSFFFHRWMLFVACEVGAYALLLLCGHWRNPVYWASFSFLALCPLLQVGSSCDFCMRASIPALFAVMVLVLKSIVGKGFATIPVKVALSLVVLVCIWRVGIDMQRTVCKTRELRSRGRPVAYDPLYSYDRDFGTLELKNKRDRLMVEFSGNILCRNPEDTFFFRYLARSKSDE